MNVWTFLALVSVGASIVTAYFSLRLAREPRSRFGYTGLRCASPERARTLYKRARAVLLPGAVLSTLTSITGLVVSDFGPRSAVWTLGSLFLLGMSMLVGWFITKKGHDKYNTQYDLLLGTGNAGPNTGVGPALKYDNVSMFDLHFTGTNIPDSVSEGDKFRFTAEVATYNPNQCLFFLIPISTAIR